MLVLKRKWGEAIVAGEVTVRVLSLKGNQIKLGIEAPEGIQIWREELLRDGAPSLTPERLKRQR